MTDDHLARAAYALRHTADGWDPGDKVGEHVGQQLKEAEAEVARLKVELATARAVHFAEAADLIATTAADRYDAIDEDDLNPSDQDQLQEWHDAADVLRKAVATSKES